MTSAEGIAAAKLAMDAGSKALDKLRAPKIDADGVRTEVAAMYDHIESARRALNDVEEENRSLKHKLEQAMRMADFGDEFHKEHGLYWRDGYPYCAVCWDVDRKPVRLSGPIPMPGLGPKEEWVCPFHKQPLTLPWHLAGKVLPKKI